MRMTRSWSRNRLLCLCRWIRKFKIFEWWIKHWLIRFWMRIRSLREKLKSKMKSLSLWMDSWSRSENKKTTLTFDSNTTWTIGSKEPTKQSSIKTTLSNKTTSNHLKSRSIPRNDSCKTWNKSSNAQTSENKTHFEFSDSFKKNFSNSKTGSCLKTNSNKKSKKQNSNTWSVNNSSSCSK